MASAIERRRRRVLDNSEERLQKILGIRSHQSSLSTEKSSVSEVDWATAEDVKDQPTIDPRSKRVGLNRETDGESKEEMDSEGVALSGKVTRSEDASESHSSQRDAEPSQSSTISDSSPLIVPVEGAAPNKWIRPLSNTLLAVLLIVRWTYLNFDRLAARGAGMSKPGQEDRHGATVEQASESFIWPFLTLQLVLLCVPQLRQITHSPKISMLTVALQLSGIPVKLTNFFNLILSFLVVALSDLCVFLFVVVLLHELVTNVAPIL